MDEELQAWCEVAQAEEATLASSRRASHVAMSEEDAAALAALRAQLAAARARAVGDAALPGAGAFSACERAVDGPSDDDAWDGGSGPSGLLDVPGGRETPAWASDGDIPSSWGDDEVELAERLVDAGVIADSAGFSSSDLRYLAAGLPSSDDGEGDGAPLAEALVRPDGSQHVAAHEEFRIATARLRAMVSGGPLSASDEEDIRCAAQLLLEHLRP